jgi:hypothetical protein
MARLLFNEKENKKTFSQVKRKAKKIQKKIKSSMLRIFTKK